MIYVSTKIDIKGEALFKELMKTLKGQDLPEVTVGVHEDAGKYPGENAPSVAEVALWNEYGTKTAPARPFLRPAVEDNGAFIKDIWIKALQNIIQNPSGGKSAWRRELATIGFAVQTLIQNKIKSNVPPPNAPSVIRAKQGAGVLPKQMGSGGTSTLINTGLMLRSIKFKVSK